MPFPHPQNTCWLVKIHWNGPSSPVRWHRPSQRVVWFPLIWSTPSLFTSWRLNHHLILLMQMPSLSMQHYRDGCKLERFASIVRTLPPRSCLRTSVILHLVMGQLSPLSLWLCFLYWRHVSGILEILKIFIRPPPDHILSWSQQQAGHSSQSHPSDLTIVADVSVDVS